MNMKNILDKIAKVSIYLLVFFLPIFFLPWTPDILDFNKQALLLFLVFISLFSWLLKSLIEGKISLNLNLFNIPVIFFLLILAIGTFFSASPYGSFWGLPLNTAASFLTIFCLSLLYFLIINLFKKEEIFGLLITLVFSSFLAVLFGVLQLFGKFLFPFDFAKLTSFNTIGTVNSLGIFAALLLPLIVSLIFISKKLMKILLLIFGLLFLILVILVNSWAAWLSLLIGVVVILTFGIARREIFPANWLTLPMFLLVISLCFGIFKIPIPGLPATPLEISPSQKATFDIARQTLMADKVKSFLFGSGPSTFSYDYSKFKSETINQTVFWGVRFSSGASEILDKLATDGLLGLISFLGILAVFLWLAFKWLIKKTEMKDSLWILGLGIFASTLAVTAGFFFYPANLSLSFLFWIFLASFIVFCEGKMKTWVMSPSSLANVLVSFLFILILILGIGLFFMEGQRYIGEIRYLQGIRFSQAGDNQKAIDYISSAISHTGGRVDNYWRDLSQVYLFRINDELQRKDISQEELKNTIPPLVSQAINSAKQATDVSPKNVANWSVRGFIYRQIINISQGADQWAINSYEEAQKLEPTNPYIFTELGQVYLAKNDKEKAKEYFQKALDLKSDYAPARFQLALVYVSENKIAEAISEMENAKRDSPSDVGVAFQLGLLYYQANQYDKAQAEFERAVGLNENYSNARYFLGLIYDKAGKKDEAISQFEKIEKLNPDNEEVKKILANLRGGKSALEGIVPAQPPIEEKPEEVLKKK
jgi:tetratricopeptide (TPR) repeat protein/O-antigen ligase